MIAGRSLFSTGKAARFAMAMHSLAVRFGAMSGHPHRKKWRPL